ncbi:transmembrane protein 182 isoform X2 [Macaca fascicularis]|uniref:transmembrane protein 182 isoform X2 n=1 Tax=Macaca fascicularis TaxID=9541 RepID=UPI0032B051B8
MRLNIAIFFGALFGALGVLLFLVAFGSDYWLLATEVGRCSGEQNIENVTFHHEGFFWRCWFHGIVEENDSSIWKFWYTNQPPSKNCTHAYLSPYPFMRGEHNSTSYDSAVIYRGFWAVLMLLGVVAVVIASFLIICAAPFASHFLYKAGGGSYIAADGISSLCYPSFLKSLLSQPLHETSLAINDISPLQALMPRLGWTSHWTCIPVGLYCSLPLRL